MEQTKTELTFEEKLEQYKKKWDNFSTAYYTHLNRTSLCLMSTLMSLARVSKKTKILDAGCGPGLGTKLLISDIPRNSTVYAFDFSSKMIGYCEEVFNDMVDFNSNVNNHWEIAKYSSTKVKIDEDTEELRKSKNGKIVKFFEGNAEQLIFEDEQFEAYVSSLLLMLCLDVDKAISEAYRVLKKDGVATFSIWGQEKESKLIHTLFNDVFVKYGIDTSSSGTSFKLGENQAALKEKFLNAGFKDVRMEYTSEIYDCFNEEEFVFAFVGPAVRTTLDKIGDDAKAAMILEEIKENARKSLVDNKNMPVLNCLIIVAFK